MYAWFIGVRGTAGMYMTATQRQKGSVQQPKSNATQGERRTSRILSASMFKLNGVNDIAVPENCISRLNRWNRCHGLFQPHVRMQVGRRARASETTVLRSDALEFGVGYV